ncbi:MAG: GHKL domain-containing protein [Ruminococcaceae bacterium]|nr:GHKL domain-containing protein [Oscillospiraceae bacterium]
MFLATFIMLALVLVFVSTSTKNRYSNIIQLYLISLVMLSIFATAYTVRMTYYTFPLKVDYAIYLAVSNLKIRLDILRRLYNVSFGLFFFSTAYGFVVILNKPRHHLIWLSLPILIFIFLNDPKFLINFELKQHTYLGFHAYNILANVFNCLSMCILVLYTLLPYFYIYAYYNKTKYLINKQYIVIYGVCITLLNIFFYSIFVFGTFKNVMFYNLNTANLQINYDGNVNYIITPFIIIAFMLLIFSILIYFKPFSLFQFEGRKNKNILKNTQMYSENLAMSLHAYKNIFWTTQQQFELIKTAINTNNISHAIEYTDAGAELMKAQIKSTQSAMEQLTIQKSTIKNTDIVQCAKNAISNVAANDIKFEVTLPENEILIFGNEQELTEVFKNLIINAIESVKTKEIDTPTIKIAIGVSNKLCIFEITDNGCGITKDNFKKVFLPFFTTKNRARNYGIGLSYVQSIVELYRGKINIASQIGEFTTFQLSFPIVSKKKGDKR